MILVPGGVGAGVGAEDDDDDDATKGVAGDGAKVVTDSNGVAVGDVKSDIGAAANGGPVPATPRPAV